MEEQPGERHPIQVVARRTGLSPDVLRAWEKRYDAVSPGRTPTGRRFYSDRDVERLLLLRRATLAGRSIGQIATLSDDDLRDLVVRDEAAERAGQEAGRPEPPSAGGSETGPEEDGPHLRACLAAVAAMDAPGLEVALHRASFALSRPQLLDRVLMPLMREIGSRWNDGNLRVANEHLASTVVRSFLGALRDAGAADTGAPRILVATPAGQFHELGAAMVAVTAAGAGWRVTYLGPNLPAEEIAAAADALGCRVIALSIIYPGDDPYLRDEVARLRGLLPAETEIVVGGGSAAAYGSFLTSLGCRRIESMSEFRKYLQGLR